MAREVGKGSVPPLAVPRLALYLRTLRELQSRGVQRVTSRDLAPMVGLNAAQIRKDLSCFGAVGRRGGGYQVDTLVDEICTCLGLTRTWSVIIVGAGSLGSALAGYRGSAEQGFRLVGVFDSSRKRIGQVWGEGRKVLDVRNLDDFLRQESVDMAVVAVPARAAQSIVDRLVDGDGRPGVRAILNFAPVKVHTPKDVVVRQVDFASELMFLSFCLDQAAG